MNAAQIDDLAMLLVRTGAPAGTYSSPEAAGLHMGRLESNGDQLALAVLRSAPAEDLQRLALEWVSIRGVQVPA